MRKTVQMRRKAVAPLFSRKSALLALALLMGLPSAVGHSDLATFLAGINRGGERWRTYMTQTPTGAVEQAQIVFSDPVTTGSVDTGPSIVLPDGTRVAVSPKFRQAEKLPDEDRVTRSLKKGRIMSVAPVQPPKDFSAGSVLQRQSSLLKPSFAESQRTAFAKPKLAGKELTIATAFYKKKEPKIDAAVSPMLASLVTNRTPDILATAYAPPEPDYARDSPFDSILVPQAKNDGRFVPEISAEDHAWAATPLPAGVFSPDEQKCLTSGIYFEARGESVKGQAAVAQVILNRVRNPTYPKSICGVVYQNKDWYNRCQFSFTCDRIPDIVWSRPNWKIAQDVAMAVTAGKIWLPEVGSATHYHATYVKPNWAPTMKKMAQIGLHVFYRTYGGGWS